MVETLVGILTTKPLIFLKVQVGRHEQGRVAQLVISKTLDGCLSLYKRAYV
jgi:hypothetical protein